MTETTRDKLLRFHSRLRDEDPPNHLQVDICHCQISRYIRILDEALKDPSVITLPDELDAWIATHVNRDVSDELRLLISVALTKQWNEAIAECAQVAAAADTLIDGVYSQHAARSAQRIERMINSLLKPT